MRINLVSNLDETSAYQHLNAYNHIIAWSLREALQAAGHDAQFTPDRLVENVPRAEHTIVISNTAMNRIREDPAYLAAYRAATDGKLCLWLDGAFEGFEHPYDRVLTVAPCPGFVSSKFRQVGWAADPMRFRPEQTEPLAPEEGEQEAQTELAKLLGKGNSWVSDHLNMLQLAQHFARAELSQFTEKQVRVIPPTHHLVDTYMYGSYDGR